MEENGYCKHYIVIDGDGGITDGWSDGPFPDKSVEEAICLYEQGGYQFCLFAPRESKEFTPNPKLAATDGKPLYKWSEEYGVRAIEP